MIISSSHPLQRVHEILQRMKIETDNVECLKTCCGALAILAKDESNKVLIAKDGTRVILKIMEAHAARADLQEAVCDLLWSLAFNNALVKELVGKQGGIALILKGMSSHLSSPELVKSACGALSNMCQNAYNQDLIAAHGGVRTILAALHSHRMNVPLLPFVFDALASLIVGNQRNGLLLTDGGGIKAVLAAMGLHSGRREVVKSGCHALAILSDIQGQGARIAGADGVKVLLPALRAHIRFQHLHRIAAIVLLRMLQEAAVAREITSNGGVIIMLGMLREHAQEEETVAATVHILYLITHVDVMKGGLEEEVSRHFSGLPPPLPVPSNGAARGINAAAVSSRVVHLGSSGIPTIHAAGTNGCAAGNSASSAGGSTGGAQTAEEQGISDGELFSTSSVRALIYILQAHIARKDIVRAAMRSTANLIRVRSVVQALVAEPGALPTVLQCLAMHSTSRGITDSAVTVAGALLAAAHASGWATDNPRETFGENCGSKGKTSKLVVYDGGGGGVCGGSGGNKMLTCFQSGVSMVGRQRPTGKQTQSAYQSRNGSALRFAYVPMREARGVTRTAAGGRMTSMTNKETGSDGRRDAGQGIHARGDTGESSTAGDPGSWNASMQALCTMLRARRRDLSLAALVFLALEACISEWAQVCESGQEQQNGARISGSRRLLHSSPTATVDGRLGAMKSVEDGEQRDAPTAGAVMSAAKSAAPLEGSDSLSAIVAYGHVFPGAGAKEATAVLIAREKMEVAIKESLKAGLVWAEAVPLGRSRSAISDRGDRRGPRPGSGRCIGAVGAKYQVVQTASEIYIPDLSFSPAMSEAVGRLVRLLRRGFVELGFGRLGALTPLGEAIALDLFEINVPEVLKTLGEARQAESRREAIENLIRNFVAVEPREVLSSELEGNSIPTTALTAGSAASTECSNHARNKSGESEKLNGGSCGSASRGSCVSVMASGSHVPHQRRTGKGAGVATQGSSGSGTVGNSGGGDVCDRGDLEPFWDEAEAGGPGLVMTSPPGLEPMLSPSCSTFIDEAGSDSPPVRSTAAGEDPVGGEATAGSSAAGGLGSIPGTSKLSQGTIYGGCGGGNDERLWLVYEGPSAAGKGVISRVNAPDPYWLGRPSPGVLCPHAHSIKFFSCFEGANLLRAVQRGPSEYDIFLRPDLHTHGHTQWFYFALRGTHPAGVEGESIVRFNVVNLTKPDSLFAMGMRPVLYSHRDAVEKGVGWRRCGHSIDYRSNGYTWYKPDGSQASFYTLSLSVSFHHPGDTYRIANAHPYTCADHKRHLAQLLADDRKARYLHRTVLCRTLGGNECELLTVTDFQQVSATLKRGVDCMAAASAATYATFSATAAREGQQQQQQLRGTNGDTSGGCASEYLWETSETAPTAPIAASERAITVATGDSPRNAKLGIQGDSIRIKRYTLSERLGGGGTVGGVESSAAGTAGVVRATGEGWLGAAKRCIVISARVHPGETPASWMMRGILDFLTSEAPEARLLRSLFLFKIVPMLNPDGVIFGNNRCSLAGVDLNRQWKRPSRTLHPTVFWLKHQIRQELAKQGVTMYIDLHGHSRKMNIFMYGADEKRRGVSCPSARVFPKLLSWNRLGRKYVSFKECSFAVKKGRESTARVVVARDLGIGNSYTVESTFCGVDFGPLKNHHLNTDHLQEAGVAICDALLDYYMPNQAQRDRAYRKLLSRDYAEGNVTELPERVPVARVEGSGADNANGDVISAGGEEENNRGRDEVEVEQGDGDGDGDGRDADDDVVDNNVDLESEDDNDSESPEAAAGEMDANADADADADAGAGAGADADADADANAGADTDTDTCPVMPPYQQQSPHSPSSEHNPRRSCVREPTCCEEPSTSARQMASNRRNRVVVADEGPEEKGMNDTRSPIPSPSPWTKVEGEGDNEGTGDSTAWGTKNVVKETGPRSGGDGKSLQRPVSDDADAIEAPHEGVDMFIRSNTKGVCVSGDHAGWATHGTKRQEHGRQCKVTSSGMMMVEMATAGGLATTATAAATSTTPARGMVRAHAGQPTSVSKRERRRHTAARGSKTLFLTNGMNRSRASGERGERCERGSVSRILRSRVHSMDYDGSAARRTSEAAASNVLAACNTPTGRSRGRVRSLTGTVSSNGNGRAVSVSNGTGSALKGGTHAHGGSASQSGGGGLSGIQHEQRGKTRDGAHHPCVPSEHAGDSSEAVGEVRATPRSRRAIGGEHDGGMVATSIEKGRHGKGRDEIGRGSSNGKDEGRTNLRWVNPTDPTPGDGTELR